MFSSKSSSTPNLRFARGGPCPAFSEVHVGFGNGAGGSGAGAGGNGSAGRVSRVASAALSFRIFLASLSIAGEGVSRYDASGPCTIRTILVSPVILTGNGMSVYVNATVNIHCHVLPRFQRPLGILQRRMSFCRVNIHTALTRRAISPHLSCIESSLNFAALEEATCLAMTPRSPAHTR